MAKTVAKAATALAVTATTDRAPNGELTLTIPVAPLPAPRPRMTKWGSAYFPASYVTYKKAIEAALPPCAEPRMGDLCVEVHLVCPRIAKSKFTTPKGDLDNLVKGVLDVLTQRGYYGDDRQIVDLWTTKRFAKPGEEPHQVVKILEIE